MPWCGFLFSLIFNLASSRVHIRSALVNLPKSIDFASRIIFALLVPFILFSELALWLQSRGSKAWGCKLFYSKKWHSWKQDRMNHNLEQTRNRIFPIRIKSFRGMDGCEDFSPQFATRVAWPLSSAGKRENYLQVSEKMQVSEKLGKRENYYKRYWFGESTRTQGNRDKVTTGMDIFLTSASKAPFLGYNIPGMAR